MRKPFTLALFALVVCTTRTRCAPTQPTEEAKWLFGRHIELYMFLLRNNEVRPEVRAGLEEGFHRFAFEYWLLSRQDKATRSPVWRGLLRDMLHAEAKNDRCFNDPGALMPYFSKGKLSQNLAVVPLRGVELEDLPQTKYLELVGGFKHTFFDWTNAFPVRPIPSPEAIITGSDLDDRALAGSLANKSWRAFGRDKLPIGRQNSPFAAFRKLTPLGMHYYLPAFLRMCERDPDIAGDLPDELMRFVTGESEQAQNLRSRLSEKQKRCVITFFEDWFFGNVGAGQRLTTLRLKLNN